MYVIKIKVVSIVNLALIVLNLISQFSTLNAILSLVTLTISFKVVLSLHLILE